MVRVNGNSLGINTKPVLICDPVHPEPRDHNPPALFDEVPVTWLGETQRPLVSGERDLLLQLQYGQVMSSGDVVQGRHPGHNRGNH